jgi:hypothetical protein
MAKTVDVAAGQKVASTWGNEVRDRTCQVFATAAERDAQWVTPPNGALCVCLDSGAVMTRRGGRWEIAAVPSTVNTGNAGAGSNFNNTWSVAVALPVAFRAAGKYLVGVSLDCSMNAGWGSAACRVRDTAATNVAQLMSGGTIYESAGMNRQSLSGLFVWSEAAAPFDSTLYVDVQSFAAAGGHVNAGSALIIT